MVDWSSPEEIARDADAFAKLIFVLFGLYTWEVVTTMRFEFNLYFGTMKFRWPLVFYFLLRYSLFFALLGLVITLTVREEIDCQSLYTFSQWAGNTAIGTATTCLMLRTIAVWDRRPIIVIPLVACSLGQWGILLHSVVTVRSAWVPAANACVVSDTSPTILRTLFFYTMGYDFIVLCLTSLGLLLSATRSSLWQLLFRDGMFYFAISFSANLVPAVLNVVNLNPVMNVVAAVPAATVSTIAATRLVVRLYDSAAGSTVYFHSTPARGEVSSRWDPSYLSSPVVDDDVHLTALTRSRRASVDAEKHADSAP